MNKEETKCRCWITMPRMGHDPICDCECHTEKPQAEPKECEHDFENVLHPARATWICPKCKEDISVAYVFWCEATEPKQPMKTTEENWEEMFNKEFCHSDYCLEKRTIKKPQICVCDYEKIKSFLAQSREQTLKAIREKIEKMKHNDEICLETIAGTTEGNCWYNQALSDLLEEIK